MSNKQWSGLRQWADTGSEHNPSEDHRTPLKMGRLSNCWSNTDSLLLCTGTCRHPVPQSEAHDPRVV